MIESMSDYLQSLNPIAYASYMALNALVGIGIVGAIFYLAQITKTK
jgi:hypothetical protein